MSARAVSLVEIAKTTDLAEGEMKEVAVEGQEILLARVGGKYYATQAKCNHMGGKLAAGKLEGTVVTCPLHHSQYDLADGRVLRWTDWAGLKLAFARLIKPPKALKVYDLKVEGDRILAQL